MRKRPFGPGGYGNPCGFAARRALRLSSRYKRAEASTAAPTAIAVVEESSSFMSANDDDEEGQTSD